MPDLDYSNPVTLTVGMAVAETLYCIGTVQMTSTGTAYINGSPWIYGAINESFYINCLKLNAGDIISGNVSLLMKGYRVKNA